MGFCFAHSFSPAFFYSYLKPDQAFSTNQFPFGGSMQISLYLLLNLFYYFKGDLCNDWCISVWMAPCAICQLARELDRMGYPRENCC